MCKRRKTIIAGKDSDIIMIALNVFINLCFFVRWYMQSALALQLQLRAHRVNYDKKIVEQIPVEAEGTS